MSLWNTFRLLFNSAIVFAVGYTIRNFTHTKKYVPNGKEMLTMAAHKGSDAMQYALKKKNRNKVVIAVLIIITAVIMCYKLLKWYERRSNLLKEQDDQIDSNVKYSKSNKKEEETESMDKRKVK